MFIAFQDFVNPVGTPVNVKDTKTKCNVQCVQSRCDEQPTRRAVGDVMAAACVCELLKSHIICEQSLFQACQVLCRYTMIRSVFTTSCGLSAKMTCVHRRGLGSSQAQKLVYSYSGVHRVRWERPGGNCSSCCSVVDFWLDSVPGPDRASKL